MSGNRGQLLHLFRQWSAAAAAAAAAASSSPPMTEVGRKRKERGWANQSKGQAWQGLNHRSTVHASNLGPKYGLGTVIKIKR